MEKIDDINSEILESLYWGNGYSQRQIGNIFGCSRETIRCRMKEYGILNRGSIDIEPELLWSLYWGNEYNTYIIADLFSCDNWTISRRMIEYSIPFHRFTDVIEPELLWDLYWGNNYPIWQIANIFVCGHSAIHRRMKECNIPRRGVTDFSFDDRQKEIFEGCMLGDGSLEWRTDNCNFGNADIHKDYLIWLQKHLGIEDISKICPTGSGIYNLETRVIPSIQEEHKRWYPYKTRKGTSQNRQPKIIPKDMELTPTKMLFWFIGDGTYIKSGKSAVFTNYLTFDDWSILLQKMYDLLNTNNGITVNKRCKDKDGVQRYILRLNKDVTRRFFDMVDSLGFDIPDCYLYKFGRGKLCQNEN